MTAYMAALCEIDIQKHSATSANSYSEIYHKLSLMEFFFTFSTKIVGQKLCNFKLLFLPENIFKLNTMFQVNFYELA